MLQRSPRNFDAIRKQNAHAFGQQAVHASLQHSALVQLQLGCRLRKCAKRQRRVLNKLLLADAHNPDCAIRRERRLHSRLAIVGAQQAHLCISQRSAHTRP